MPLNRRQFVATAVATGAATGLPAALAAPAHAAGAATAPAGVAPAPGGLYTPNAAPLAPTAFLRLPPGAVTARGWLDGQLRGQLAGLCGQYASISHFLDLATSGWTHPANAGWEEVPYWLRGYADLAALTGDATALAAVRRWIDAIVATAQPDGFFGPTGLRTSLGGGPDFWPFLPLTWALRNWQEYSGDTRIIPLLTAFFRYMNAQGPSAFNQSWVSVRWGDGLDSVFWLYNRTGDAFLLSLADKIHSNGANWVDNLPSPHNVNIAQGFREPAQYALRSPSTALTQAAYQNYTAVMTGWGQFPGGGFAGDENTRPGTGDPRQGFETCGIVEFMASHELLTRITGDPVWADRCEDLAFNSLPAALDPAGQAIHYITSANSVDLDNTAKTQGQFQNGFAMQSYQAGVDQYRCCPHNYGMGWTYFTEELWLATPTTVSPPRCTPPVRSPPKSPTAPASPSPRPPTTPSATPSRSAWRPRAHWPSRSICGSPAGARRRTSRSPEARSPPRPDRPSRWSTAPGTTATPSPSSSRRPPPPVPGRETTAPPRSTTDRSRTR